jgi:starvation-inducible outer membrane lipoprotein
MTPTYFIPALLLTLAACTEEATPQQAEKAANEIQQDEVKQRQLSIEQAAEEATKLIEADAKEEADAAKTAIEPAN